MTKKQLKELLSYTRNKYIIKFLLNNNQELTNNVLNIYKKISIYENNNYNRNKLILEYLFCMEQNKYCKNLSSKKTK